MMQRSKMRGVASRLSSHVLCMTRVFLPPMKISLVYLREMLQKETGDKRAHNVTKTQWAKAESHSSIARLLSPTYGTYLITTTWSGCSSLAYLRKKCKPKRVEKINERAAVHRCSETHNKPFDSTMSSTTLLLLISLLRNCSGADKFFPSLLPK